MKVAQDANGNSDIQCNYKVTFIINLNTWFNKKFQKSDYVAYDVLLSMS